MYAPALIYVPTRNIPTPAPIPTHVGVWARVYYIHMAHRCLYLYTRAFRHSCIEIQTVMSHVYIMHANLPIYTNINMPMCA